MDALAAPAFRQPIAVLLHALHGNVFACTRAQFACTLGMCHTQRTPRHTCTCRQNAHRYRYACETPTRNANSHTHKHMRRYVFTYIHESMSVCRCIYVYHMCVSFVYVLRGRLSMLVACGGVFREPPRAALISSSLFPVSYHQRVPFPRRP